MGKGIIKNKVDKIFPGPKEEEQDGFISWK